MTKGKAQRALGGISILSDLSERELDEVFGICKIVEARSGDVVMKEGDEGDSMYLFASGEVDVSKNLTMKIGHQGFGQVEKSMTKLKAEHVSVFGEMALFEKEPRSATVTASTDCVLYEVHREAFAALCERECALALKILKRIAVILCRRVRKGNEDVLKLSTALSIALSK
jgi:CRP-like cAMP-binding protein